MTRVVELTPGFQWDCPTCGESNVEADDEAPPRVVCINCEDEFDARLKGNP